MTHHRRDCNLHQPGEEVKRSWREEDPGLRFGVLRS